MDPANKGLGSLEVQESDEESIIVDDFIIPDARDWSKDEKKRWFKAWKKHEFDWDKIAKFVGTKNASQCKLFRIKQIVKLR